LNAVSGRDVGIYPAPLMRLRDEFDTELPLVQLLGENAWGVNDVGYDAMYTPEGLTTIADHADGIGVPIQRIVTDFDAEGGPAISSLVADAGAAGLEVHPCTLRADPLPTGIEFEALVRLRFTEVGVDGVFTDHPDRAVAVVRALQPGRSRGSSD
jgi:glycerophosphoryl diester phosphodiesterase